MRLEIQNYNLVYYAKDLAMFVYELDSTHIY